MNKIYLSNTESLLPYPDQEIMQKVQNDSNSNGDDSSITQREGRMQNIQSSNDMTLEDTTKQRLFQTRELCTHNSHVAERVGQIDKAKIWKLLAKTAEDVATNTNDAYDGWYGLGNGATGRGVIKSILKFYEVQGDV